MANDTVVSVVNTVLYGNSKKYPLEETSEETVVQWAVATKQLLLAHPELAKVKRLLDDSISPEAKAALWSCSEKLAAVPKEYPSGSMTTAARVLFHQSWLDQIIEACAPSSTALVLNKMRQIRFSDGTGDFWTSRDIMTYYARLQKCLNEMGGAVQTVSEKAKLEVVSKRLPSGLALLVKATLEKHTGVGPAPPDTWERALERVSRELKKQEDCLKLADSVRIKNTAHQIPEGKRFKSRDVRDAYDHGKVRDKENTFKKKKKPWREGRSSERRGKGAGKTAAPWRSKSSGRGAGAEKDASHIKCYNCGEMGHYANKCPKPTKNDERDRGKGKGKGSGKGRGGGKGPQKEKEGERA